MGGALFWAVSGSISALMTPILNAPRDLLSRIFRLGRWLHWQPGNKKEAGICMWEGISRSLRYGRHDDVPLLSLERDRFLNVNSSSSAAN